MPIFEYKCGECGKKLEKQFSVFAPQVKAGESKKCLGCRDNACPHAQG